MTAIDLVPNINAITGKKTGTSLPDDISVVGSLAGLRLTIQNGLVDGGLLKIESTAHTFEEPESFNYLGFGGGWLYNMPIATYFDDMTVQTAKGAQLFEYENSLAASKRYIYALDGLRYLRTDIWSDADPANNAGGMINWNSGRTTVAGDRLVMYTRGRCTVGSGTTDPASIQLKDERMGAYPNLEVNVANSAYLKSYSNNTPTGETVTLDSTHFPPAQAASGEEYYQRGINKKGAHYTQLWQWKLNAPDVANGGMLILSKSDFVSSGVVNKSSLIAPAHIQSLNPEMPQYCKWQAYIGNNTGQTNIEWLHTDLFCQLNGSIFAIANAAVITSATEFTPLIPQAFIGAGSWWVKLWKGKISSYTGTYIHLLDADFNSVAVQQLG